jgi:hypothetical protein
VNEMSEYNESDVAVISVDGVEFEALFKSDNAGLDLMHFGADNEWADGKHYAGLMQCLRACSEENLCSASVERKGSIYSVKLTK